MKNSRLTWATLDWAALDRLRDTFLAVQSTGADYWMSRSDLENYDFTFAQRIAWKWDAVLRELGLRGWAPPPGPLLDWGCGSGVAGRRVVGFFGPVHFHSLRLFDRSPLAMCFAAEAARKEFPRLRIESWPPETAGPAGDSEPRTPIRRESTRASLPEPAGPQRGARSIGTLVVSHVLNELDEGGGRKLRAAIERAEAVIWVEPGTYADSRSLIAWREALCESFRVVAPCTHQAACGLRSPENARHWCHHFANLPAGVMADSNWVRFARRAGIDLRSLPYSFLALERKGLREPLPGLLPDGYSRFIGRPRIYKGFARIFNCQSSGVRDLTLQKRDAPELFKAFKNRTAPPVYRWDSIVT